MSSRDLILGRVRRALAGVPDVEITRAYRGPSDEPGDIRLFEERVRDYRAVVHLVDEPGVAERVARSLADRGARRVVVPAGFPAPWLAAADAEAVADDPPLSAAELDAVDGVLTTCAVAIAETGTIVLDAGPGQEAGGRSRWCPTITCAWCGPQRSSPTCRTPSPGSPPLGP